MNRNQETFRLSIFLVLFMIFCSGTSFALENNSNKEILVNGNNTFAFELYSKLKEEEGNLFLSPFSISTALALVYAGARENTEKQIAEVLHFDLNQKLLHPAFAKVIDELNVDKDKKAYELITVNALWGQKEYRFLDDFLNLIKENYDGTLNKVDFVRATEKARKIINTWVEKKTRKKIKELIKHGVLTRDTVLVLTNAIYFKGKWVSQFEKKETKSGPFTLINGKIINVSMMNQTEEFNYFEDNHLQVLELPYVGEDLSMFIFLPKELKSLKNLEKSFTEENIKEWLSKLSKQEVKIILPKFKMTSDFELSKTLKSMGMTDAFSGLADFSGMSSTRDILISNVIHKAFVKVNEEGTEAAAATAVVMLGAFPGPKPIFIADHPFLFLIRHNHSGSILFIGRVVNPKE